MHETNRNVIIIFCLSFALLYQNCVHGQKFERILSSRWFHPTNSDDTLNTLAAIEEIKPQRIDWMYCDDEIKLQQLIARNIPYSLAINPQVPDSGAYTIKGRITDFHGSKLTAPWMLKWKISNPFWGCVNSPIFQEIFFSASKRIVDLKAYGIFVDDARFNDHACEWGGFFCEDCMKNFTIFLIAKNDSFPVSFNYHKFLLDIGFKDYNPLNANIPLQNYFKEFQHVSVVKFLKDWKAKLLKYSDGNIKFLTNNGNGAWTDIYSIFDIGIAEVIGSRQSRAYLQEISDMANAKGKKQIVSIASIDVQSVKALTAYCKKINLNVLIPWDLMVESDFKTPKRIFFNLRDWSHYLEKL